MACVNAVDERMPPMFVLKGKTSKSLHGRNTECALKGSRWAFQTNGWMDDSLGERWFNDVFLKHCGHDRPQLLILDGHSSHETLGMLMRAMEENIHIHALPPHTTHALQPLDKCVFAPLNHAYNDACSQFLQENPWNQVNKRSFPGLFAQAWKKSVTPSNILSGFRSCGIYPLNKEVLPNSVFGPSEPTDFPFNPLPVSPNQSQSVIEEPSSVNVCSLNTANELLTAFPLPLDTQDLIPLQSDDDTTTTTHVVDTTASNIIDISDPSLLQLLSEEAITIDPLTDKCGNDVVIPIDFELSSVTPSPSFPGNVLSFTDTTEYEIKSMFIP